MKWNRFNLLSPAGERRGRPPTDIAAEAAAAEGRWPWWWMMGKGGGSGGGGDPLSFPAGK